jgi:hypothetical protein
MMVSLSRTYTNTTETLKSVDVTMVCASEPLAPDRPTMVLGNRDIIHVEWRLPTDSGGSPVRGFLLYR